MVVEYLLLTLLAVVGLAALAYGATHLAVASRLHTSEEDAVRDAVAGTRVNLEGTPRVHEETLEAPVSGRECLGYEYTVEKYAPSGRGPDWNTLDSGGTTVPFLLDAGTGTVLVSDANPSLAINDGKAQVTVDPDEEVPGSIRRFVERTREIDPVEGQTIDLKLTETHTGHRRRYTEYAIVPGETTYVAGVGERPAAASVDVPREASALVGPPERREFSGFFGQMKRHLWPLSFLVADASMKASRNDYLRKGVGLVLFGLLFGGIPSVLILQGLASATF